MFGNLAPYTSSAFLMHKYVDIKHVNKKFAAMLNIPSRCARVS